MRLHNVKPIDIAKANGLTHQELAKRTAEEKWRLFYRTQLQNGAYITR